jgi:hypothetical protein
VSEAGSDFRISRAFLQFEVDRMESLLEALDDGDCFHRVYYTFALLFADGLFQHIYFVDKVGMEMSQSRTSIAFFVHHVLLPFD